MRAVVIATLIMVAPGIVTAQNPASPRPSKAKTAPQKDAPIPAALERDVSFNLLEEAYANSRDLSSELRIPLLTQICQSASSTNSRSRGVFTIRVHGAARNAATKAKEERIELSKKQKARLKEWTEELYLLGNEFPSGSKERGTAELAATRAMLEIDLDRALEMFDAAQSEGDPFLDSRAGIEFQLFDAVYRAKGAASLPDLRRKAIALGDQGTYPYGAVSNLLHQVKGHPEVVRQFFSDAITYYRRSNGPIQRVFGILGMIGSKPLRDQLELWQVQDAAQEIAAQAKRYVQSQRELQTQGASPAPGASMVVTSVRASLKSFAPEIAATIPDPPAFIPSTHSTEAAVPKLPSAPVPDESLKTLRANFEANRTAVMAMNEDDVHDGPEMQETLDRAVTQGAEVVLRTVRGYDPQDHVYAMRSTIGPLIDTVQVGTRVNPAATLASIRRVQDSELKAQLLIVVAGAVEYMHY
jgi:hypothetical protein